MCVARDEVGHDSQPAWAPLDPQHMQLVRDVRLLQEDKGEDGVRAQSEVIRGKAFPQCKESFFFYHFSEDISSTLVLRDTLVMQIIR